MDPGPHLLDNNGFINTMPHVDDNGWRRFYVIFNRPLRLGAKITLRYRFDLVDLSGTFRPFAARTVHERNDYLEMRVKFPEKFPPVGAVVACMRAPSPVADKIMSEQKLDLDPHTNSVLLSVPKPRRKVRYSIEWSWSGYAEECARLTAAEKTSQASLDSEPPTAGQSMVDFKDQKSNTQVGKIPEARMNDG
ncbi:hypothetical protein GAR06_06249 [Micromonospora saelicesensis]|nr:hypothetical protein GAR06_06249 [Micromonospora saelicesensis]